MMKWLFGGIVILSTIFAIFNRTMEEVSNAALNECQQAVEFMLTLLGSICLWSGFMKIAERSGLTKLLAKALSPLTRLLFPSIPKESKAMQAISMNITANLLGLGNAATPLGITAMKELKQYAPSGLSPDTISVVVRGLSEDLDQLEADAFDAQVDVSAMTEPGVQIGILEVNLSSAYELVSTGAVTVTISEIGPDADQGDEEEEAQENGPHAGTTAEEGSSQNHAQTEAHGDGTEEPEAQNAGTE